MRLTGFLFFTLFFYHNFSYAQHKEALKQSIQNLLIEQKLSGAVWTVVSGKGDIVTDAYGYKNAITKDLLSTTHKLYVGSVAKTVLAAGILRMATLGSIKLNDPVKKILPNIPIENPWDRTDPVTIRHLLDHTSGITDAKLWHVFSTTATPDTPLETVYLNSPKILKVQAKPGSIHSYSNLGYTILGMVIEKLTRKRYEEYLDEELLMPLEMMNSSFQFISQNTDKQLAYGHYDKGEPITAMPMYLRPAGQLATTGEDMGKFLRFMMSDGTIKGKPFINKEYLASVGHQKFTDAYKNGVPFGDALGAYSRDRYGLVGIAKNGNTLGFSAMIYFFPEVKRAFFIAYNMDSETANYDLFNETIVKHLVLSNPRFIAYQQNTEKEISNWNGYYIPVITKVEPFGLLDHVFSHTKVVTLKSGALLMPFQGKNKALIYQGKHLFSMKDRTGISHAFYNTSEGASLITDGITTIKKVSGIKILAIAVSLLLGISGLIYLLISGCINLVKFKFYYSGHPVFWVFISILTMSISFIFIATQPFVSMGDLTAGNILLAVSTFLIPFCSFVSLVSIWRRKRSIYTLNFWATVFVMQLSVLLIAYDLMPIIMWK